MTILDWMEQTSLAVWVSESPAGYYIMLGFHAIGLAVLVGIMTLICLQLLGVVKILSASACTRLVNLAWCGFAINALSGLALFFAKANQTYDSTTFRWKILLVFLGVIAMAVMNATVLRPLAANANAIDTRAAQVKIQAVVSLAIWFGVITVGRMIAYM